MTLRAAPLLLMLLAACGPHVQTRGFDVVVAPKANDRTPVAVDFVKVRSKETLAELLRLSARDWYARREQILRDHPASVEVRHWEFVPGQTKRNIKVDFRDRDGVAVVVFARYFTPGPHRARVETFKHFLLRLDARDLIVERRPGP